MTVTPPRGVCAESTCEGRPQMAPPRGVCAESTCEGHPQMAPPRGVCAGYTCEGCRQMAAATRLCHFSSGVSRLVEWSVFCGADCGVTVHTIHQSVLRLSSGVVVSVSASFPYSLISSEAAAALRKRTWTDWTYGRFLTKAGPCVALPSSQCNNVKCQDAHKRPPRVAVERTDLSRHTVRAVEPR